MSNQGIRGYYQLTQTIKTQLLADININTVSIGDISEVNLNKQDIFPLAHIIINSVTDEEQVLRFNITIIAADIVDQSKDLTLDRTRGNNNEQDILNTQLGVLNTQLATQNKLVQILRKGTLNRNLYQLDGNPNCEPFSDRFENMLAGWSASMDVLIWNDITIC